jgi:hypothetical protein
MNESLDKWIDELLSWFQANVSSAIMEADTMKHTFADKSKLDVQEYITRKIQLYTEAGEDREDLIVRRLYQGLDLTLANAVPLWVGNLNTIRDFTAKVYTQEPSVHTQFKQYETYFKWP